MTSSARTTARASRAAERRLERNHPRRARARRSFARSRRARASGPPLSSPRVVGAVDAREIERLGVDDDAISPPALAAQTRKRAPSFRPARLPRPASRARVAHSRRAPRATRARRSPRARARPTDRLHVFRARNAHQSGIRTDERRSSRAMAFATRRVRRSRRASRAKFASPARRVATGRGGAGPATLWILRRFRP